MSPRQKAISAINKNGALLVFPVNNKKEPASVWSELHPRSKMRWEWDENGDGRVAQLWHLREELSRSGEVVYSKWYQGRATCFSKKVFVRILAAFEAARARRKFKNIESQQILEILEMDSPQSTRDIKESAGLKGRSLESLFNRAMKELWLPGLVVGFGEVEDSSFPSLAVGATKNIFEDLWLESQTLSRDKALKELEDTLGASNLFFKFLRKNF